MEFDLYFHPLASYCWKVLIALYENETPFAPHIVDLGDPVSRAELEKMWPFAKFPVLRDRARDKAVPESTIIIEYLSQRHPGKVPLVPADPGRALDARFQDRFYDVYVHEPMQKIVGDKLRPAGKNDPQGVALAREVLEKAYGVIEGQCPRGGGHQGRRVHRRPIAAGTRAHYANRVLPFGKARVNTAAFLSRLEDRPSFRRVITEAQPYFHLFPDSPKGGRSPTSWRIRTPPETKAPAR